MLKDGGYQDYVSVHHKSLVSLPKEISFEDGSFMCCTAAVSLRAMKLANIKKGDKILITGCTGGVGVHAIQIAVALGAMTICITSNPKKVPLLIALGAHRVIVSNDNKFHRKVLSEVGPVDIVLELVGGPTFQSSFMSVKPTGTIVVVGNISVGNVALRLGRLILTETKIIGSSGATPEDVKQVLDMITEKKLIPVIADRLPLTVEGINSAHQKLQNKSIFGRIVITSSL